MAETGKVATGTINPREWVDFSDVKQTVSMRMVLDHYGITGLRKYGKGNDLRGVCPVHKGENDRSFSVSLEKNAFRCFSCKARGNQLDLVAALEDCSVRDAALKLKAWFIDEDINAAERPEGGVVEVIAPALQSETPKLKRGIYRHFKGGFYMVEGVYEHTETGELLVAYKALYGDFGSFVRPLSMFTEHVEREGYAGSRFTLFREI